MSRGFSENPHYSPKKCGLEQLATFDEDGLSYEYNTMVFWRDIESGEVYCAYDSGCSCPTPFEHFHSLSDLTHCPDVEKALNTYKEWGIDINGARQKIMSMFTSKITLGDLWVPDV